MNPKKIQVCLSPSLLPYYDLNNTIAVVIDIFRASSSMCYGLANGARSIIPVAEISECQSYQGNGYLLAAERDGEVVDGFDFGNSPFSYTREKVAGRTIVLTTTNGTRAIQQCTGAEAVVIGSFLNITALSNWLKDQDRDLLLVCAGWKNHVSLEDTVFAGALVDRLIGNGSEPDDAAYAAQTIHRGAQHNLADFLTRASHSKRMQHLNIKGDIAFCLSMDMVATIPILKDGVLTALFEDVPAAQ